MSKSQIQQGLDQDNQPNKLKIKSSSGTETPKAVRKVRIIYTDPYATDDSDEDNDGEPNKPKRFVTEINLPVYLKQPKGAESEKYQQKVSTKSLNAPRPSSTLPKGVRKRKWGKFSAEIQDPFNRKKQWLGTYATAEAAAKAYEMKKLEIDAKRNNTHSSPTALCLSHNQHAVSQNSTNVLARELPSSTLEGESPSLVSPINQKLNGTTVDASIQTSLAAEQLPNTYCEDEPLDLSLTEEYLDFEMELNCLFTDDPVQVPEDSCNIKDLQVRGLEDSPPTNLSDFDFDFDLSNEERAWMDEASNMIWP